MGGDLSICSGPPCCRGPDLRAPLLVFISCVHIAEQRHTFINIFSKGWQRKKRVQNTKQVARITVHKYNSSMCVCVYVFVPSWAKIHFAVPSRKLGDNLANLGGHKSRGFWSEICFCDAHKCRSARPVTQWQNRGYLPPASMEIN
jgi:hypothetical protein